MKVTARQQPSEHGLARVCQSPRGYIIKANGEDVGRVCWGQAGWSRSSGFWFWYARVAGQSRNTSSEQKTFETREAARDDCVAWVKATLPNGPDHGK